MINPELSYDIQSQSFGELQASHYIPKFHFLLLT